MNVPPLEVQRQRLAEWIADVRAILPEYIAVCKKKPEALQTAHRLARRLINEAAHFRDLTFRACDQSEWLPLAEDLNALIDEARDLVDLTQNIP